MAKKSKQKQYSVPMRWEFRGEAVVMAGSAEEAAEKAEKLKDTELQENGAELVNWEVVGEASPNE